MNDTFKPILDALIKEGFYQLPDTNPKTGKPFDYKITPYSLNTKLSFRFDSLDHFIEFLRRSRSFNGDETQTVLQTTFMELGLKPNEFFYVNFFEKGKTLEM
jgi:hypothetical protein